MWDPVDVDRRFVRDVVSCSSSLARRLRREGENIPLLFNVTYFEPLKTGLHSWERNFFHFVHVYRDPAVRGGVCVSTAIMSSSVDLGRYSGRSRSDNGNF